MFMLIDGVGDVVQWTSPVGAMGILAGMFHFYRQDRKDAQERLKHLMERYHTLTENFLGIVERNTAAVTELTVLVKRLNGVK